MRRPSFVALALMLTACAEAHGGRMRETAPEPPAGAEVCGGAACADGEECCRLTLRCVVTGDPSCAIPPGTDLPRPCTRASDCAEGEVCEITDPVFGTARCAGYVGTCVDRRAGCAAAGNDVCGCDGRTYPDACAAYAAGVEVVHDVACGTETYPSEMTCMPGECFRNSHCDEETHGCVHDDPLIACGIDEQCPTGQRCCGWTGECFDPSRPASCARPPDGTFGPCTDDLDCERRGRSHWLPPSDERWFCEGEDTCGGPGGCIPFTAECDGVLDPVCGCDGNTYENECEAHAAQVAVDPSGECAKP